VASDSSSSSLAPSHMNSQRWTRTFMSNGTRKTDSDEPQGRYSAKITSVSSDGTATVLYRKGKMLETIDLSKTNWFPAPGNGKWYLPSPPLQLPSQTLGTPRFTKLKDLLTISLCSPLQWKTMQQLSKLLTDIAPANRVVMRQLNCIPLFVQVSSEWLY